MNFPKTYRRIIKIAEGDSENKEDNTLKPTEEIPAEVIAEYNKWLAAPQTKRYFDDLDKARERLIEQMFGVNRVDFSVEGNLKLRLLVEQLKTITEVINYARENHTSANRH